VHIRLCPHAPWVREGYESSDNPIAITGNREKLGEGEKTRIHEGIKVPSFEIS